MLKRLLERPAAQQARPTKTRRGEPGVLVSLVRGSSGEGEGGLPEGVPREGSMASSNAPQALQQQPAAGGEGTPKWPPRMLPTPRVFLHGSSCTGWHAFGQAFSTMALPSACIFGSDISKHAKSLVLSNFKVHHFFDNVNGQRHAQMGDCQLYEVGFPCQPYSSEGVGKGLGDRRSQVIWWVIQWIAVLRPWCFILENVKALLSKRHRVSFEEIVSKLASINEEDGSRAYTIVWKIINSADFKAPTWRLRLYIVGTRRSKQQRAFVWPDVLGRKDIIHIFDKDSTGNLLRGQPGALPTMGTLKMKNVFAAKAKLMDLGKAPGGYTHDSRHWHGPGLCELARGGDPYYHSDACKHFWVLVDNAGEAVELGRTNALPGVPGLCQAD